jgi:ribosomal protein L35
MTRFFLACFLLAACSPRSGQKIKITPSTRQDTAKLNVARLEVFPAISGSRLSKISLANFRLMGGMSFYIGISRYHWEPLTVKSYRFTVIRNGQIMHSNVETTHKFGEQSTKFLDQLQTGDLLLFSEIQVRDDLVPVTESWPAVFEIQ